MTDSVHGSETSVLRLRDLVNDEMLLIDGPSLVVTLCTEAASVLSDR